MTLDVPQEVEDRGEALIQIARLNKRYRTETGEVVDALRDVSLDIYPNEFIAIVGASGCGKSTLLKIVAGLLSASSGQVLVAGQPVRGPSKQVGIVFQSPVLLPWRNVLKNVLLPVEMMNLKGRDYQREAQGLLQLAGLERFARQRPYELSGGMKQRVALCRALISDPRILLMDEPFGALDALTREEMTFELLRIWSERPKTVLFITHSISEAVLLADRVIVMTPRPGQVAEVVMIDILRPRTQETLFAPRFQEYSQRIKEVIFSWRAAPTP